ncbi:hypothetical protein K0M31_011378 [Melipona bicolor]|uniref:Uncharacterized protein n=1 Tax=Melipona bicolor TaxID=60889 RepID=A0AA40G9F3_9HYME|nr:hypothetical protein K0M31_011378 [Melipona bicolor]
MLKKTTSTLMFNNDTRFNNGLGPGALALSLPTTVRRRPAEFRVVTPTWIKEQPGSDDSQGPPLPLGKNQPLQHERVSATAVSNELRQRGCGSCKKKNP